MSSPVKRGRRFFMEAISKLIQKKAPASCFANLRGDFRNSRTSDHRKFAFDPFKFKRGIGDEFINEIFHRKNFIRHTDGLSRHD